MNVFILGRMQEGKSTLAIHVAQEEHALVIFWDPRHQVDNGIIVHTSEQLEQTIEQGEWTENRLIVFQPNNNTEDEFAAMTEVIGPYGRWTGGFGLIVDEAAMLQGPNWIDPNLDRLVRQSKNEGPRTATIVQTTHRLSDMAGSSRSLVHRLILFQTTYARDLEKIEEYTQSPEVVAIVQTLPQHHYVDVNLQRGPGLDTEYEVCSTPQQWFSPMEKGVVQHEDSQQDSWKETEHAESQGW